jgi:4-amino-4-deoxy-L-arabinose transferase-like glycosyltransferase
VAVVPEGRRFILLAAALTLLAFALRASFFLGAQIDLPVRGDIVEYWHYAQNLVRFGVFSRLEAGSVAPPPDAWRSPGYPLFLAACMRLTNSEWGALALATWLQMLVGALQVPLTIALGRRWMSRNWALLAGFAVAAWPHLVVFASTLLTETLFAFALLLAAWLASVAQARDGTRTAALAGIAAGFSALVNPLVMFFPPVWAAVLASRGQRRVAGAFLLAFALVAGAWELRNASLPEGASGAQRAQTNFVQGSWPRFLDALNYREVDEIAAAYFGQVQEEVDLMHADPRAGMAEVGARLRAKPGVYLRWYLLEKPWLLWSWDVRVGWGDIYFLGTERSPFRRVPMLQALHAGAKALNPVVFALALAAALFSLASVRRPRAASPGELARLQVALLCCYVSAVHNVLQAEPRYAVAYRPLELLLAVAALALAGEAWRLRRGARS